MKLMKKSLILLLSTFALVGCGGKGSESVEEHDVEVIWWNNYQVPEEGAKEEEARKTNTYREYYYAKDLIAAFEAENPHIKITTVYQGSYSDIAKAVKAGIDTGNIPTIASTYQDNVATYVDAEVSYDMSEFAKELEKDSDFNKNYLDIEKGCFSGKYYSLPYSKSAETLVVNKTVFDKVGAGESGTTTTKESDGKTINVYTAPVAAESKTAYTIPQNMFEVAEVARKMKADYPKLFAEQRDDEGYFKAVPFCWDSTENMFITMMENSSAEYTDGSAATLGAKIKWNTQAAKDVVIQLKKWNNEGLICTQNQLPITINSKHKYSSDMVVAGKIFMSVTSTSGARYFATDGGFQAQLNHNVNWAARTKADDAKVISQGPSLTFFRNKDTAVNEAAFKFYKFLTNTENSAKLAVNTAYFPLRASSYQTEAVKNLTSAVNTATAESKYSAKNSDYTGQALKLNETYASKNNYYMSDAFVGSADIRTAVGNLLNDVFNDQNAKTDDEIATLVNTKFQEAFESVTK